MLLQRFSFEVSWTSDIMMIVPSANSLASNPVLPPPPDITPNISSCFLYVSLHSSAPERDGSDWFEGDDSDVNTSGNDWFEGDVNTSGNDWFEGDVNTSGNDWFEGDVNTSGNDWFEGDDSDVNTSGNDWFEGDDSDVSTSGNDWFEGDVNTSGNDWFEGDVNTSGNDWFEGDVNTSGNDWFEGDVNTSGNDWFEGDDSVRRAGLIENKSIQIYFHERRLLIHDVIDLDFVIVNHHLFLEKKLKYICETNILSQ
ncbi:hypothetical protein BgiMline_004059 [Biomphalaria glabrata]